MLNEIEEARQKAEESMGFEIPTTTADYILGYTIRKFLRITAKEEKPEGYFGILYQNEIEDYFRRIAISAMSERAREERAYV